MLADKGFEGRIEQERVESSVDPSDLAERLTEGRDIGLRRPDEEFQNGAAVTGPDSAHCTEIDELHGAIRFEQDVARVWIGMKDSDGEDLVQECLDDATRNPGPIETTASIGPSSVMLGAFTNSSVRIRPVDRSP